MSLLLDTRFADMAPGVANRWLNWARSHDWGENAGFLDTGKIAGCREYGSSDEMLFSTPREMRDWAGY